MKEKANISTAKSPNKKIKKAIIVLILIIAICICAYSGYLIYQSLSEYKEIDDTYNEVTDMVVGDDFTIDWDKLLAINGDVIAWLRIPDTAISYPVVQYSDNSYYLTHNIYKNYSKGGVPFVSYTITNPFEDYNTIIYGHNLNNGSIFSDLKKYKDSEFAKEHNVVYVYLPDGTTKTYQVFAFYTININSNNIPYNTNIDNLSDYYSEIEEYNTLNIVEPDTSASIITLSTCTNTNKNCRYILQAYLIN